ncbi:MAG: hypothetical protein AAGG46_02365 [Planctomycetota bacterium]
MIGLAAAWVSRWSIGRRLTQANRVLLCIAFFAIAMLAALHAVSGFRPSLLSAATLAVMAVGAVLDCKADRDDQVLTRVMAAYE